MCKIRPYRTAIHAVDVLILMYNMSAILLYLFVKHVRICDRLSYYEE